MYTDNVLFEGLNCVQNVIVSVRVWLVSFIAVLFAENTGTTHQ